jgi:hypothetical protein
MRFALNLLTAVALSGVLGSVAAAWAACPCEGGPAPPPQSFLNPPPIDPYAACDWKDDFYGRCTKRELLYQTPRGDWYILTDALALQRDSGDESNFATLGTPTNSVLGSSDLDFEHQGGLRTLVGRQFGERYAVEGTYFGLMTWDESESVRDPAATLFSPFSNFGNPGALADFDNNDFASIRTESSLDNIEISIRQWLYTPPSMMRASALYGVRYMTVNENFEYRTESAVADNAIDVRTENHLIGFQFGGSLEFYVEPRAWITFEAKGTMCNNAGEQQTTGTIGAAAAPLNNFAEDNRTGFIGDISLTVMYAFTRHTVGRIGYQAMWVEGLALASENLETNVPTLTLGPSDLVHDGSLIYHGPFVGLMTTW